MHQGNQASIMMLQKLIQMIRIGSSSGVQVYITEPDGTLPCHCFQCMENGMMLSTRGNNVLDPTCGNTSGDGCIIGLRSEEHTSELQSLLRISYAVFCLKKKK